MILQVEVAGLQRCLSLKPSSLQFYGSGDRAGNFHLKLRLLWNRVVVQFGGFVGFCELDMRSCNGFI